MADHSAAITSGTQIPARLQLVCHGPKPGLQGFCLHHGNRRRDLKRLLEEGGRCELCDFVAGLEDVYTHLEDHDFLREMERWLPGWRDPLGKRRRWLSLLLERSCPLTEGLSYLAEQVASFVFPAGHPLDSLVVIENEDLLSLNIPPASESESE